jgi:pyruvyltransferase
MIKAWWHKGDGNNFGDVICPTIIKSLTGENVEYSSENGSLLSIGSILFIDHPEPKVVWGAGAINETQVAHRISEYEILSVRGPKTRKRVNDLGIYCPEKYGDPAILLPYLFEDEIEEDIEVSIMPHWIDLKDVKNMKGIKKLNINVIDIRSPIDNVIKEIKRSKMLITSSLHGVIVGEAFEKDTRFVRFGNKLTGGYFKFEDYYNSTGRSLQVYDNRGFVDINVDKVFSSIVEQRRRDIEHKNIKDTIDTFPYKIKTSVLGKIV